MIESLYLNIDQRGALMALFVYDLPPKQMFIKSSYDYYQTRSYCIIKTSFILKRNFRKHVSEGNMKLIMKFPTSFCRKVNNSNIYSCRRLPSTSLSLRYHCTVSMSAAHCMQLRCEYSQNINGGFHKYSVSEIIFSFAE